MKFKVHVAQHASYERYPTVDREPQPAAAKNLSKAQQN